MKKILAFSVLMISGLLLHAQIKQGAVLLGGQLYYSNSTQDYGGTQPAQSYRSSVVNVISGKAFRENAVWGLSLSYNPSSNDYNVSTGTGSTTNRNDSKRYSAGIIYRQYKKIVRDLYFFSEAGGNFLLYNQSDYSTVINSKVASRQTGGEIYLMPGASYNLFKKFQVEVTVPNLFYTRYLRSNTGRNDFTIGTSLTSRTLSNLGIGFKFIL